MKKTRVCTLFFTRGNQETFLLSLSGMKTPLSSQHLLAQLHHRSLCRRQCLLLQNLWSLGAEGFIILSSEGHVPMPYSGSVSSDQSLNKQTELITFRQSRLVHTPCYYTKIKYIYTFLKPDGTLNTLHQSTREKQIPR